MGIKKTSADQARTRPHHDLEHPHALLRDIPSPSHEADLMLAVRGRSLLPTGGDEWKQDARKLMVSRTLPFPLPFTTRPNRPRCDSNRQLHTSAGPLLSLRSQRGARAQRERASSSSVAGRRGTTRLIGSRRSPRGRHGDPRVLLPGRRALLSQEEAQNRMKMRLPLGSDVRDGGPSVRGPA